MGIDQSKLGQLERLLAVTCGGTVQVAEELSDVLYQELRRMADRHLRQRFGKAAGCLTLQPTALVNETLLRVIKGRRQYDSQGHFFAIANTVMKRVLVDYAREKGARKRGGGRIRIEFDPDLHSPATPDDANEFDVEALFEAMERLALLDARKADVVRMRVLWGMAIDEIASSLGVSRATVERDWRFGKAWIARELVVKNR